MKKSRAKAKSSNRKSSKRRSSRQRSPKSGSSGPFKVGFLVSATQLYWGRYTGAFETELKALGWTVGPNGNIQIDYQPPKGAAGNLQVINQWATNFTTKYPVDVIVTAGFEAANACKQATSRQTNPTPVVFASVGDPVGCNLVARIQKPGGNLIGCSNMQTDPTVMKDRVTVMQTKLQPRKVGVVGNNPVGNPVCPIDEAMDQAVIALKNANIPVAPKTLGQWSPSDFQSVQAVQNKLVPLKQNGVDVLLVCSDPVVSAKADNLVQAAHSSSFSMRTMHEFKEHVDLHGGDQSYGPDFQDLFIQAANFVDQILRQKLKPSALSVYQPTTYVTYP